MGFLEVIIVRCLIFFLARGCGSGLTLLIHLIGMADIYLEMGRVNE